MIYIKVSENGMLHTFDCTVSDSVRYETVKFDFPKSWDVYTKTAVFRNGDNTLSVILNSDSDLCVGADECYIPHEVIKFPEFTVSVFGVSGDSRVTASQAVIRVIQSGYGEGGEPSDPTPSEYEQLINLANETKQIAQSVRTDADNGVFKGDKGDRGPQGEKGETGAQGPQGLKGDKGDKGDTGEQGIQGEKGEKGDDGYTPQKGVDYFTEEDIAGLNIPKVDLFANALKANKSGSAILIDDVSPVTHDMGVKVRGKNLFDPLTVKYSGGSTVDLQDGNSITVGQTSAGMWTSANFEIPNAESLIGKTISISAKAKTSGGNYAILRVLWFNDAAAIGVTGMSIISKSHSGTEEQLLFASGEIKPPLDSSNKLCIALYSNTEGSLSEGNTYTATYSDIQIEIADAATAYTPYVPDLTAVKVIKSNASGEAVAEYTPNADGTVEGVSSLYPNTTLTTDTDGVLIDCEYNRDLNKSVQGVTVDQTYSPTSNNSQSGKAVAEAVEAKLDKPDSDGTTGQILGLDDNLLPAWIVPRQRFLKKIASYTVSETGISSVQMTIPAKTRIAVVKLNTNTSSTFSGIKARAYIKIGGAPITSSAITDLSHRECCFSCVLGDDVQGIAVIPANNMFTILGSFFPVYNNYLKYIDRDGLYIDISIQPTSSVTEFAEGVTFDLYVVTED